ncbi:MAG: tryptophan-rich sensory protein [Actinobacteria bacterium]|nr:tryptophan-rich sensory protein [Actinomycetota bacterium]MCB9412196.1 tryptophan-rich sensory protein [Actinomycetota bacterium]
MEVWRGFAAVSAVVLVVGYAIGAGVWVASGREFYEALSRPPWQPPDVVFGLIWPYNFVVLAVAGVLVALAGNASVVVWWLSLTALSIVAALGWAWLFYVGQALWPAAVALAIATVLTIPVVILTWRTAWIPGILLVPYVLWLATATSLAVGYALRN